jgi:hypothetical protein
MGNFFRGIVRVFKFWRETEFCFIYVFYRVSHSKSLFMLSTSVPPKTIQPQDLRDDHDFVGTGWTQGAHLWTLVIDRSLDSRTVCQGLKKLITFVESLNVDKLEVEISRSIGFTETHRNDGICLFNINERNGRHGNDRISHEKARCELQRRFEIEVLWQWWMKWAERQPELQREKNGCEIRQFLQKLSIICVVNWISDPEMSERNWGERWASIMAGFMLGSNHSMFFFRNQNQILLKRFRGTSKGTKLRGWAGESLCGGWFITKFHDDVIVLIVSVRKSRIDDGESDKVRYNG